MDRFLLGIRRTQLIGALREPRTWAELQARKYGPEQQEMPEEQLIEALASLCVELIVVETARDGCSETVYALAAFR